MQLSGNGKCFQFVIKINKTSLCWSQSLEKGIKRLWFDVCSEFWGSRWLVGTWVWRKNDKNVVLGLLFFDGVGRGEYDTLVYWQFLSFFLLISSLPIYIFEWALSSTDGQTDRLLDRDLFNYLLTFKNIYLWFNWIMIPLWF